MQYLQLAVWPDALNNGQRIDTVANKEQKQRAYDLLATIADIAFLQAGATQGAYNNKALFKM